MARKRTTIIVDEDLWRAFKVKVAMRDETCTDVLNRFIHEYLSQVCDEPQSTIERLR